MMPETIEEVSPYTISRFDQIIDQDLLQTLRAGFCVRSGDPLTIVQRSDSGVEIIEPIEGTEDLKYSKFCEALKGTDLGKQRCAMCSENEARVVFDENIQEPYPYFCHMGLNCLAFPIVIEGRSLAVFLSGKRWDPGYAGGPEKRIEILEKAIPSLGNEELEQKLRDVPRIGPRTREKLRRKLEQLVANIAKPANDRVRVEKSLRQRQFLDELRQRFKQVEMRSANTLEKVLQEVVQRVVTFCDLRFALLFADLSTNSRHPSSADSERASDKPGKSPLVASVGIKGLSPNLCLNIAGLEGCFSNPLPYAVPTLDSTTEEERQKALEETLLPRLEPADDIPECMKSGDAVCVVFTIAGERPAFLVLGLRPANTMLMNLSARDESFFKQVADDLARRIQNSRLLIQLQVQVNGLQRFMRNTGHDLKGPLQEMLSDIGDLRDLFETHHGDADQQYAQDERIEPILERVEEAVTSMDRKLNNLESIANLETDQERPPRPPKFARHPVGKLVEKAAAQFRRKTAERGIEIELSSGLFHLSRIEMDWELISSVFTNLIDNAVKYSHANKKVDIRGKRDGDHVEVSVGDFGLGIPESEYKRIFEPHYISPIRDETRSIEGMGMGLAIVKENVEKHHGRVWVECKPNPDRPRDYQGCLVIFTVRLPLAQPEEG